MFLLERGLIEICVEYVLKNNTSPGNSWTIIAGEKSQFEVTDVMVRIEKAIMHDYTHFEGLCSTCELLVIHVLLVAVKNRIYNRNC